MGFNEKLKKLRKAENWSQTEFAKKLGVHVVHVNRLEKGKTTPSMELIIKLADILNVTIDYLIRDNNGSQLIKINDKKLLSRVELLQNMDEESKNVIIKVIDAISKESQMKKVINGKLEATKQ